MAKKTRAYSLSEEVYKAVQAEALRKSNKAGKRVSESSVVESILSQKLIKKHA